METQEILSISVQIIGMLFIVGLGSILVWSMTRDGRLTANEASKVVAMVAFIYAMIVNGVRSIGTDPIFDSSIILILLGSILTMAGIETWGPTKSK